MSEATLNAVHEAIAAHVADEADGIELLTEWVAIAAAVIADDADHTSYWFLSNDSIPYHSQLGLVHRALRHINS